MILEVETWSGNLPKDKDLDLLIFWSYVHLKGPKLKNIYKEISYFCHNIPKYCPSEDEKDSRVTTL